MKKVLFLMTRFYKGGTEKAAINLINNLDPNKYEITLVTIAGDGGYEELVNDNIKKICLVKKYKRGLERILRCIPIRIVYRILVREEFDVEVAVGDGFISKIIASSTNKKSKKIAWIHMDVLKGGAKLKEFKNENERIKFYEPFNNIVCVSESCKDSFNKKFGQVSKTVVKYNLLEIEDILFKANEKVDEISNNDEINIISVGRLTSQKGYDRLIKVHKKLLDDGLPHNIYILGEGEDREILEKYINENNINDSFILLGFNKNPYAYMKKADLFVCSSRHEAFSTVLAESIILGTPILTTECSGTHELLGNNEYGIIVENKEEELYKALKKVLIDKKIIKNYRDKSNERAKFFSLEKSITEWEKIL